LNLSKTMDWVDWNNDTDEQIKNKLLNTAVNWKSLDRKYMPYEKATMHAFTPAFQNALVNHMKKMNHEGNECFDEQQWPL
jgi:hypothetical protein